LSEDGIEQNISILSPIRSRPMWDLLFSS